MDGWRVGIPDRVPVWDGGYSMGAGHRPVCSPTPPGFMASSTHNRRSAQRIDQHEEPDRGEVLTAPKRTPAKRRPGSFRETVADEEYVDASAIWAILMELVRAPDVRERSS